MIYRTNRKRFYLRDVNYSEHINEGVCINCNNRRSNQRNRKSPIWSNYIPRHLWKYIVVSLFLWGFLFLPVLANRVSAISSERYMLADNFYPSADGSYCEFAQTVALSYRDLPMQGKNGLYYDSSVVGGERDNYIVQSTFFDVGNILYPNARRYNGVADHIAVPPDTLIEIGAFVFNYSTHDIDIRDGWLFLSLNDPSLGNFNRLGAEGIWLSKNFLSQNTVVTRSGFAVNIGSRGVFPPSSWSNPPKGFVLYSFKTIQPISIGEREVSYRFKEGDLIIDYILPIKNNSQYFLSEIFIEDGFPSGDLFREKITLVPGEEKRITYSQILGNSYPLEINLASARVKDRNIYREVAAKGASSGFTLDPDSKSLLTLRGDLGSPSWWSGAQGDFAAIPQGDFLSIELIPYDVLSNENRLVLQPDLFIDKQVVCGRNEEFSQDTYCDYGDEITFKLTVTNNGPYVENVEVVDRMDFSQLEIVDDDGFVFRDIGAGEATIHKEELFYVLPELKNSETKIFYIKARYKDCSVSDSISFFNIASLSCINYDCGIKNATAEVRFVASPNNEEEIFRDPTGNLLAKSGQGTFYFFVIASAILFKLVLNSLLLILKLKEIGNYNRNECLLYL